jgi:hypothetical protein
MTSKAIFALLVAFSLPALAQDLPERVERLESTIEVMLVVESNIAVEVMKLQEENRLLKLLIEGMIGDIIELKKGSKK